MKTKIDGIRVLLNFEEIRTEVPFVIDMDQDVNYDLEDIGGLVKIEPFNLGSKKMLLSMMNKQPSSRDSLIDEIGSFWGLTKSKYEVTTSYEVNYPGFPSGTAIVYCLDTDDPSVKVLLCFTYKGDAGRSPMIGVITNAAKITTNDNLLAN